MRTISNLPLGRCSVTIILRRNNEEKEVNGEIVQKNGTKHLIVQYSPKKSFGPGTKMLQFKREVKSKKTTL